jgi:hypothetical protein
MIVVAATARVGFGMAASAACVYVYMGSAAGMNVAFVIMAAVPSPATAIDPRVVVKPNSPVAGRLADVGRGDTARPSDRASRQDHST